MVEFIDNDGNVYGEHDVIPSHQATVPEFVQFMMKEYWKNRALDAERKLGIELDTEGLGEDIIKMKKSILHGMGLRLKEEGHG